MLSSQSFRAIVFEQGAGLHDGRFVLALDGDYSSHPEDLADDSGQGKEVSLRRW